MFESDKTDNLKRTIELTMINRNNNLIDRINAAKDCGRILAKNFEFYRLNPNHKRKLINFLTDNQAETTRECKMIAEDVASRAINQRMNQRMAKFFQQRTNGLKSDIQGKIYSLQEERQKQDVKLEESLEKILEQSTENQKKVTGSKFANKSALSFR